MAKSLLIAGNNKSFSAQLATAFRKQLECTINIIESNGDDTTTSQEGDFTNLYWDSRSVLSTKTTVMRCANSGGGIDSAFLIYTPEGGNNTIHEIQSGEIERKIDIILKGYLYLCRELIKYFLKRGHGSIGMVLYEKGMDILPPLEASLSGGFRSLTDSLFQYYKNEPLKINGFYSGDTEDSGFSEFIVKVVGSGDRKGPGKWYNFSGKSKIFFLGR
jgi:hypothetical protein